MNASEEILPGCTKVAPSPPELTGGSSFSSYVIPDYTTLSYCELVTWTTSGNPHLITAPPWSRICALEDIWPAWNNISDRPAAFAQKECRLKGWVSWKTWRLCCFPWLTCFIILLYAVIKLWWNKTKYSSQWCAEQIKWAQERELINTVRVDIKWAKPNYISPT